MATTVGSGTQTCTVTTEHTLDTEATFGSFVATIDLAAAVAGDVFRLRVKTRALTGGTTRVIYDDTYSNAQGEPIKQTPPVLSAFEYIVTLTQVAGTSRNVPWRLDDLLQ